MIGDFEDAIADLQQKINKDTIREIFDDLELAADEDLSCSSNIVDKNISQNGLENYIDNEIEM